MPRMGLRKLKGLGIGHTRKVSTVPEPVKTRWVCECGARVAPPSFSVPKQTWIASRHLDPADRLYCHKTRVRKVAAS